MKSFVILCLVAVAVAAPPYDADILRYENDNIGTGNYKVIVEQSDGTKKESVGELRNEGREGQAAVVRGSYSWKAPDGFTFTVTYEADELGYRSTIEKQGVPNAVINTLVG